MPGQELTVIQSSVPPASFGETVTLLAATAVNEPGAWIPLRALHRTFVVLIEGTKAVDIEGSADGVTALPKPIKANITASDVVTTAEVCHYVRLNPKSGDGTASGYVMI